MLQRTGFYLDACGNSALRVPADLSDVAAEAQGREVNGHSHRMFCSSHLAVYIYGAKHEQFRITWILSLRWTVTPLQRTRTEQVESSSVSVSEGLLTPPQQPSCAAAVSSTAARCLRPVGLRYASDHFRGRPQLVVEPQLRGYLLTIIENGKIIQELPEVPEECAMTSCSAPPWSN